ncbi:calmegin isoform X2 [Cynoglossus semilaevis]|uniref:calmegin isoform X2 n=1 Tax=Cynoglossus semilaevis TaxID=244447 RepID=UPI0007DC89AB|nr:calnexin isoform X2 [Cynoglossus semilaevis]
MSRWGQINSKSILLMKLDRGWMWLVLLLFLLAAAAVTAQEEDSEVVVADVDDDVEADDDIKALMAEDEKAKLIEKKSGKGKAREKAVKPNENVSFQVTYKTPVPTGHVYFTETFDDGTLDRWQMTKSVKEDAADGHNKYDGKWAVEQLKENKVSGDQGLVLKSRAKHHGISAMLEKPFVFENEPLIIQYEVNFQDGIDCGGAYIKLLSDSGDLNLEQFDSLTPYTIMFGPDKCGENYKLHFIFRHQNPLNKDFEEKHAKRADVDLKKFYTDKKTHLYTLVLNPDNSYEIFIDQSSVSRGNLLYDVVPPVNPPREIDDPNDSKPKDWDERAKIPDPEAEKPDDWDEDAPAKIEDSDAVKPEGWLDDEEEFVPDPNAEKPEDWDEEMDGEWEAPRIPNTACQTAPGCGEWKRPMVNNPKYKGKWKAPLVDNPNYQGVWKPHKIINPEFFEDLQPFRMMPIKALGMELWSMTSDIYFDNFILTSHKEVADRWASDTWGVKKLVASANEPGIFAQLMTAAEERPWLWVIYILTIGLPVGLVVLFCWPKKTEDTLYAYREIEVPQAEEEEEEEEEEDDTGEAAAEEEEEAATEGDAPGEEEAKEGQEDLDGENLKEGDEDDGEEEEEEDEKEDDEGTVEENGEEESTGPEEAASDELKEEPTSDENQKQGVRKRRVRKD